MKPKKPMTILVSNIPVDAFERVAAEAAKHGVAPQKSDVVRWGFMQFIRSLDEPRATEPAGQVQPA